MKRILLYFPLVCSALVGLISCQQSAKQSTSETADTRKLKALIIDGQNNHGIWPKTTAMMKDYLEQTGMFDVSIERTALTWQGPANDMDPCCSSWDPH